MNITYADATWTAALTEIAARHPASLVLYIENDRADMHEVLQYADVSLDSDDWRDFTPETVNHSVAIVLAKLFDVSVTEVKADILNIIHTMLSTMLDDKVAKIRAAGGA